MALAACRRRLPSLPRLQPPLLQPLCHRSQPSQPPALAAALALACALPPCTTHPPTPTRPAAAVAEKQRAQEKHEKAAIQLAHAREQLAQLASTRSQADVDASK